ncbi:MAG: DUF4926 domain-containing protein [Phycisphaerales bacterium]|nr:MAG: DUF4926 domain-containing protein [Phycisphaerales bacterium]
MLIEHDVVTVVEDVPDRGLSTGDVGAVVHCYPDREAYEVDFVDETGRSKGVVTLTGNQLLRLNLRSLVA